MKEIPKEKRERNLKIEIYLMLEKEYVDLVYSSTAVSNGIVWVSIRTGKKPSPSSIGFALWASRGEHCLVVGRAAD